MRQSSKKKSIRNKRIKRIKIVRNIEDIRLKRLIEKQSELHQYRVKGVKIGAVLPLQHGLLKKSARPPVLNCKRKMNKI